MQTSSNIKNQPTIYNSEKYGMAPHFGGGKKALENVEFYVRMTAHLELYE
jgi:hypothetical protein